MDIKIDGQTDRQMDIQRDENIDRWIRWAGREMCKIYRQIDGKTDRWVRWIDRQKYG
jgi:hypothetical protein